MALTAGNRALATLQPRRAVPVLGLVEARERRIPRRVAATWGLMLLNALGYTGTFVHIPSIAGKAVTQGALPVALLLALSINRKIIIRPNIALCLITLLPLEAIVSAMAPEYFGSVYRTFRLIEFVAVLWLLTPWWGRRDVLLARCHLGWLGVVLLSVLLGLLVAPGHALGTGRLSGVIWDIPPTQVAHYAAVATGLVIVFWLCGEASGRLTLLVVVVGGAMLVLTHTRTALIGMVAAILVAGMSLIIARARVRKLFAVAGFILAIAIMTLSSFIIAWLSRGESSQQLTNLTGRTEVWGPLLNEPRSGIQEIFGFGLSNSSFNGLPIDSNWLSSYQEQGIFGVAVCILILVFLFINAYFQPRSLQRALALFLLTYCLIASFTEDGFTDATPYLLEIALAASLLITARRAGQAEP
jgi:O-Antigen ligase